MAALTADGRVVCWGSNNYQQCAVPFGLANVVGLSCAPGSLALTADGELITWGVDAPALPKGLIVMPMHILLWSRQVWTEGDRNAFNINSFTLLILKWMLVWAYVISSSTIIIAPDVRSPHSFLIHKWQNRVTVYHNDEGISTVRPPELVRCTIF
jgi:hypothetical protein